MIMSISAILGGDDADVNGQTLSVKTTSGIVWVIYMMFQFVFSVLVVFAWLEWSCVTARISCLDGWTGLGLTLLYLAVSALVALNYTDVYHESKWAIGLCFALASVGLFFVIAGCCGGKSYIERAKRQQQQRALALPY